MKSQTGLAMGTPMFMAPEQARDSKNVDARADIYSFGATIFNAIAGRPPFVAPNMAELIVQIQTQPAPPLSRYAPNVSSRLDGAIATCLEKRPENRPATIRVAWDAIHAVLERPATNPTAFANTAPSGEIRATSPRLSGGVDGAQRPSADARFAPTRASDTIAAQNAGKQTTLSAGASELSHAYGPHRTGLWVWMLAGAAVLTAVTATVVIIRHNDERVQRDPTTAPFVRAEHPAESVVSSDPAPTSSVANPEQPIVAPISNRVVRIDSEPTAAVYSANKKLGYTPLDLDLPLDGSGRRIRLQAPGYRSESRSVSLSDGPALKFTLIESRGTHRPTSASPRPGARPPPQPKCQLKRRSPQRPPTRRGNQNSSGQRSSMRSQNTRRSNPLLTSRKRICEASPAVSAKRSPMATPARQMLVEC